MAPGRRRGAKGAKANNLNLGDLVLAKVKGFPAWPAKISDPANWQRNPDPKKCFVHFFGTDEIAFVAPVDIQPFTRESKDKLLNRCKGKTVKYFSQAVREICDVFEGRESKSSDSLKDGNDGERLQLDANYMEPADDGMTTDGPSGQTSPNDILNQGPGLERCSQTHKEMDNEDVAFNISPFVSNDDLTAPNGEIMPTSGAGHNTNSKTGAKVEINGQKSMKIAKDSKNDHDHDGVDGNNKINSPVGVGSAFLTSHANNEAAVSVANQESKDSIKRTKSEPGLGKGNALNNGVLHPTKKSKYSDDTPKKSQTNRKNEEVRKSTLHSKTKSQLSSKGQTNGSGSGVLGDDDFVPVNKRRRLVLDDMSSPPSMSENRTESSVKSGIQVPMKRRAVRICDDDDEDEDEPKTPVHGRPSKVVDKASHTSLVVEEVAVVTETIQEPMPNSQQNVTSGKAEPENKSSEEILKKVLSPIKSPVANNQMVEPSKVNKSMDKVSSNVFQKKGQSGSSKVSTGINDSGHHPKNTSLERNSAVISGEKQKITSKTTPKLSSRVNDSAAVSKKPSDSNLLSGFSSERSELRVDRTTSLADSGNADSSKSMRHLIAVAQAKRKEAHSHSLVHGRSPGFVSVVQPTSQAADDQPDSAEFERRASSGHRAAGGSLSGGTEAAVARDAFEGMIETLSRTKESIGRATRHAIDCAKHGIASEVVELLTRKLENESSLHRKVDLLFLVDSITQCSHSQKGIAGATYIPIVQEALPRILGAAAPPGANARENRRQCLKVLKLWLERKILPDSLLRRYIDDIGSSNDDTSGFFSKRPSRAERAVDDPIREMEGMLVDEYGSNATFQLPGLLSSNVFEEEEEEDDDILNLSHKEGSGKSVLEQNTATGELETCSVTSNERRHCILEDVDGELEMEDVSGHPKDEKKLPDPGFSETVQEDDESTRKTDTTSPNSNDASPLREGSPPLPPDSPPLTPPLPSSPPPPLSPPVAVAPPPPSSPSPQPPPPPPTSIPPSQTYPVLAGPPQVPLNPRIVAHADAAVRGEVFPQQPSFLPAVHETYTNPQGSQPQQFQNGNVSLPSRTFQPPMPTQTAAGHFQYPNPAMQQHPYPPRYGITKPPDGMMRYCADEQWRPPPNEFGAESQRGAWISNGRPQLSTGPPFVQEGYFRPPMERPPTSNVSFQPTGQNIVPAGAPVSGHNGSLMMSSHNSWRPT